MKKRIIIICSAVIAAALITGAALITHSSIFIINRALKKIDNAQYSGAQELLQRDDSDYAKALSEYCALRIEIRDEFPSLLTEYDSDAVNSIYKTAVSIYESGSIHDKGINEYLSTIQSKTLLILTVDSDYSVIAQDVISLLDVFSEYNRLHVQVNGENTAFTLSEEYAKLDEWQRNLDNISSYASEVPEYESVYLLSYLIKEARSEILQLRSEMDAVSADGYGENDSVHYSGSKARNFPQINNGSGTVIEFSSKTVYIQYLRSGIRSQLVSSQLERLYYNEQ